MRVDGVRERSGDVLIEPDPDSARGKVVKLTPWGRRSQESSRRLVAMIEERWEARFGAETIANLRAALPPRETLPHHPAVLHRGGFPDGS